MMSTQSTNIREGKEDEDFTFMEQLIGAVRFVVFILSLALVVVRNDRMLRISEQEQATKKELYSSTRHDTPVVDFSKDHVRSESSSSDAQFRPRYYSRSSRQSTEELETAFVTEERTITWLSRILRGGGLMVILFYIKAWFFRKA